MAIDAVNYQKNWDTIYSVRLAGAIKRLGVARAVDLLSREDGDKCIDRSIDP